MLVRKYKYWIYRDKDRDGIADDDEDGGTAFTPQRHNSKPLVVDGKEPILDDYKALFSNIPADGSVKVSIKQKPDLSKKGTARAVLEFSVDGVNKNGRAIVIIDVKIPVEESANAAVSSNTRNATTAATASSSTRESSSVESVGQPENGNVNKKEDIMFLGVITKHNKLSRKLMSVRGEISIIGSLIVLSHTVVFGVHYFPMLFTNPAAMPTRQMIAAIVTLILLAMLIPLFITSFKSVRRKMNGKTWKNIQRIRKQISTDRICLCSSRL